MTDKTINISESNLEKGLYDETGAEISNNKYIRTKNKLSGDASFLRYLYNFKAVRSLPLEGSFDGMTGYNYNAVACDRLTGYTADANYKIEYWWFKGYDSNGRILYVGSMMLRTPVVGGNKQDEAKYFSSRACWQTSAYADRYVSTYVEDIDENADTITYYINGQTGETVTTSLKEFITNSTWYAQTENFIFTEQGKRDSELVFCNVGVLGYRNSVLVYNDRWNSSDMYRTDFLKYAPIDKFHMVFEIPEVENPAVDELIQPHIILVAESWYLDDDDKLNNIDLPESTGDDIYTPPYPATMWYLDSNRKLSNMLLPEPYSDSHSIVHDNPDGTEYFNQHSNAYDSALSSLNNNYRIRLEILTDEETTIGEITKDLSLTATGQITINYEQITRRSCSLSLINVDNKYIPTKNSPFWLNRKFRLWLGLVVGKDTYWWSQGIFYTVSANATGRILSIEGVDKGGALDGTLKLNMTEAQYQFKRGKALTEIIKQTLALDVGDPYGANNSPIGFGGNRPIDSQPPLIGIEYYGFNTVADISIDANSYISEMFVNMAELYAADCYYNTNGNLVFEQHIDSSGYNYVPTQWSFTDLSSTFEDVNYEYSYEGENVVTVYTNTTESGVRNVAWTAYNTNPLSPLNVATGIRRAPHIEIPYYNHIDEVALAQAQADLKEIETEMKTKGIDATVTVYGNIDCNNRQIIYWDEANLERFADELESWGFTPEELAGSISTVEGMSNEYDGVEIAFSPMLQTENGAVFLHADVVDAYITQLLIDLGSGWTKEGLLAADVTGMEIDGVLVKKLIADAGSTAIHTGEAMHYVGKDGALQLAKDEIYAIQNANEAQQIKDCRSTANHYLLANSMLGMTLNFNSPIIPHMDVNKSISISDQYADIEDGIYVVQSITIPLSSNKMQISATNINWLPNDMTFGGVSEIVENNQNGGAET